jgi:putative oxidoreductase
MHEPASGHNYKTVFMLKSFPFLSLPVMLPVLRYSVALIIFLHSVVRVFNGTIPQFGDYLTNKGLPFGKMLVIILTIVEIGGAILMAFNFYTRKLAAVFFVILLMGIILIHAERGWFVGEHGAGGIEYSFILMIALMVIAAGGECSNKEAGSF